jgi:hypothetical protein
LHNKTLDIAVVASLLHFAPHALHLLLLAHVCSYALDHAESELEDPMEQAQGEASTNLDLHQGKP